MSTNENIESALPSRSEKMSSPLKEKIISKNIGKEMSTNENAESATDLKLEEVMSEHRKLSLRVDTLESSNAELKKDNLRLKKELNYSANKSENLEQIVRGEAPPLPLKRTTKETRKTVKEVVEHYKNVSNSEEATVNQLKTALKGSTKSFWICVVNSDPQSQMKSSRNTIVSLLNQQLKELDGLKFSEVLKVKMIKGVPSDPSYEDGMFCFNSYTSTITEESSIRESAERNTELIVSRISNFQERGSNSKVGNLISHYVNISKHSPLGGKSYMKLDKSLQHPMRGLINLQNKDNECFRWCHIRHLNPQDKDPQRSKKEDRKMVGKLNYEGIEFPVRKD
jgi:hypothetical protein